VKYPPLVRIHPIFVHCQIQTDLFLTSFVKLKMNITSILYNRSSVTILVLLIVSCKKQESQPHGLHCDDWTKTLITNPALLKCKFQKGTYWVFNDSLSGKNDTRWVTGTTSRFRFEPLVSEGCDSLEWFIMSLENTDKTSLEFYSSHNLYVMTHTCFHQDYVKGLFVSLGADNPQVSRRYDSLHINGISYKSVSQTDTIAIENKRTVVSFFNADVGFLRNDIFDPKGGLITKKVLIDHKIIR